MSFLLSPVNSAAYIKSQEDTFKDIRAYLLTLEAPKYPFPIDAKKATSPSGSTVCGFGKCASWCSSKADRTDGRPHAPGV